MMLPRYIKYDHLRGWGRERTKYFLTNLKLRHEEIRTEFFAEQERLRAFHIKRKSDPWNAVSKKITEWRQWWTKLLDEWIVGTRDITQPL